MIKRYSQDEWNQKKLSQKNLQGLNFQGRNLEDFNFEKSDIRGADFTDANLKGTNFKGAVAGLKPERAIALLGILFFLATLFAIGLVIVGELAGNRMIPKYNPGIYPDVYWEELLVSVIILFMFLIFIVYVIKNQLETAFQRTLILGIIIISFRLAIALVQFFLEVPFRHITLSLTSSVLATVVGFGIGFVAVAIAIAILTSEIIGGKPAYIIVMLGTFLTALSITVFLLKSGAYIISSIIGGALACFGIILGNYIAICALSKEKKYSLVLDIAIFLAATGGTSFHGANLTDANFTRAALKSTDFRNANLTRTRFHQTEMLDRARPGKSYLQNSEVCQLLVTGRGENKNFDRQDFRGINLQGANLENTSFIDTDFYQANLSNANLSRTLLVRTNFERADLRGANLTGSCIQDWVITESTKLDRIACDRVYLKWDGDKRDQMPPRGKFTEGGFVTFVRYILETVELYHEKDINPRLALTVLQKMSRDYDEPLDIVALGKKGERVFIQVKVSENIIRENFKEDYYSRYDTDLKLWSGNIHQLPPAVNSFIEKRISEIVSERTDDFVFVDTKYVEGNYTEIYQGEVNMSGDRTINMGDGNYNERIEGNYVQGDYNAAREQSLAEAAAQIQQLLQQLQETNPSTTETEKILVAAKAADEIKNNPPLKARVIGALKSGGKEAFKEAVDNPIVNVLVAIIEGWQEAQ